MRLDDLGGDLVAMFDARAAQLTAAPLLHAKHDGAWHATSWAAVREATIDLARGLAALGVGPGDRVAIVAENRPEWCVADLAILRCGAITVPSYTTYTTDDYAYHLADSGAVLVILAGKTVAARLLPAVRGAPAVRAVVTLDAMEPAGLSVPQLTYAEVMARGAAGPPWEARATDPQETACIIYTSGTGGRPKGVMLSHRNIMANVRGTWALFERYAPRERVFLSFLPLSHSYEHTVGQFLPIAIGGQIHYGQGVEHLSADLLEVRPGILPCVPRLFEVLRARIMGAVERKGGISLRLFRLAVALGTRRYHAQGRLPLWLQPLDALLDRLVRAKVKERFGGRITAMVCGGGPLNPEIGILFTALGIPVCHGYGQTETSPVVSVTPPWSWRLQTVGPPLEGVEVRIAPEDGEILVKGDLVMKGYWQDPEATARTVVDGWLRTGDVGLLDPAGYLQITDRKKDLMVLSGGDNVAPQRVEALIAMEPEIAQVVVHGDRRAALVALIVPSAELLREASRESGLAGDDPMLGSHAALTGRIETAMRRANARLSAIERVRRWALLPEAFTIENGLMTPTMKLKRAAIYQHHAEVLAKL